MKKWFGLGIVLLVIVLCGYYAMGIATERTLKKNIDVLNQSNKVDVVLERYKRGWFSSQADLKWTISVPQENPDQIMHRTVFPTNKIYTFEIPVKIYHGPIMWANSKLFFGLGYAHADARIPKEFEQKLLENYNLQSQKFEYSISIFINYLNRANIKLAIPRYTIRSKQGENFFQWMGMATSIEVSGDKQRLEGDFYLKGFSWKDDDIKGLFGPLKADYDMHQAQSNLYVGNAQLKFSSMAMFKQDQTILRITDGQIQSDSDVKDGLFNSNFSAKLSQLVIMDRVYSRSNFDLSFKNIDANVLALMNRKLTDLQKSSPNGIDKQKLFWTVIPDLPALLSKGAQMKIDNFETNLSNGHVKVDLSLGLPNESLTNPMQLVQKIEGESHIRISQALLLQWIENNMRKAMNRNAQNQALNQEMQITTGEAKEQKESAIPMKPQAENAMVEAKIKANEKIKEWSNAKVLVKEGTDYLILLKLLNGKLFINGHVFDPGLLMI